MNTEERLIELEVKFSHTERLVAELNDVLYQQQRELDALKDALKRLEEKTAAEPGLVDAARNDRPPHY